MLLLIVYINCLFLLTGASAQGCFPCVCPHNGLAMDCSSDKTDLRNLSEIPNTANKNVNELYFKDQSFTTLKTNTFSTFYNLTLINFQSNKIQDVEKQAFTNLTKLTTLQLYDNKIRSLPDRIFQDLRQIKEIDLSGNNIRLSENLFCNLSTLQRLFLYGNKIKTLPDMLFQDLRQIKYIDISKNSISELPKNLFVNLPNLRTIDIAHNDINTIEPGSFSKLPSLSSVFLQYNKLKTIEINIIDNKEQLQYFNLFANPWHCDRHLCAVMDFLSNSSLSDPTCRSPTQYEDKTWKQMLNASSPKISNKTINVKEGGSMHLGCEYCFVSKIVWCKDMDNISRDHSVDISTTSLISTLILSNVTQDDSGYYSCHVQSCDSRNKAGAYLNVLDDKVYTADHESTASNITRSTSTTVSENVPATPVVIQTSTTEVPNIPIQPMLIQPSTTKDSQSTGSIYKFVMPLLVVLAIIIIATICIAIDKRRKIKLQNKNNTICETADSSKPLLQTGAEIIPLDTNEINPSPNKYKFK